MDSSRLRIIALIGAVAIVLLALVCAAYMVIAGRDLETTMPIIIGFATPTVTTLLAFGTMQNQVNTLTHKVDEIATGEIPKVGEDDNQHTD